MMARIAFVIVGSALLMIVGGCARASLLTESNSPAASPGSGVAGHWRGTVTETGGWYFTGTAPLDLRIAEDGRWSGTIGKDHASGRIRGQGKDVVLEGTAVGRDGHQQAVYYQLRGDNTLRWGSTMASFPSRDSVHAEVRLTKEPSA
jgi:hypothetical protein